MKKIFIGSSEKAKKKAIVLRKILEELNAEVTCWFDINAFVIGEITIEKLLQQSQKCNGAVFIFDMDEEAKESSGKEKYLPRDNVIAEAGMFIGSLGKSSVALCYVPGVHEITDFKGVTYLKYDSDDREEMKDRLKVWLDDGVRGDCLSKSRNNIYMSSRKDIHHQYTIDSRLHLSDGGYQHIRKIRVMNIASNLIINPEMAERAHIQADRTNLSEAIQKILMESNATLELVLLEPSHNNLRDAVTRLANPNVKKSKKLYTVPGRKFIKIFFRIRFTKNCMIPKGFFVFI